jgi:hypothetical protein
VKIRVIRGKRTNHILRHQPPDSHEFHELPRKTKISENSCNSWQKEIRAIRGRVTDMTNIVVIGMGYPSTALRAGSGIPCAALLADVGWRLALPSPASSAAPSAPAGRRLPAQQMSALAPTPIL